jgi:hypothetical protein
MNAFLPFAVLFVLFVMFLALLINGIRTKRRMQALMADTDAAFQRCIDGIDASMTRLDAHFEGIDRRLRARTASMGAEWNLPYDGNGRIVSGWAY